MKLLSPKEIEKKRRDQEAVAVMRGARIASLIDTETKKLNTVKDFVSKETSNAEEEFSKFVADRTRTISELEHETEELESRKAKALEPITEEYQKLEAKQLELSHKAIELSVVEAKLLSDRNSIQVLKSHVEVQVRGVDKDKEETEKALSDAQNKKHYAESLLEKSEKESKRLLKLASETLNVAQIKVVEAQNEKNLFEHKLKLLDDKEKELTKKERRLESDRATLLVAFDLAKKQGIM